MFVKMLFVNNYTHTIYTTISRLYLVEKSLQNYCRETPHRKKNINKNSK